MLFVSAGSPWARFWARVRVCVWLLRWGWSFLVAAWIGLQIVSVCFAAIAMANGGDRLTGILLFGVVLFTVSIVATILHIARSVADEQLP